MQYFYSINIDKDTIKFDVEESRHMTRTLRKKTGDFITVLDGLGSIYSAIITNHAGDEVSAEVHSMEYFAPLSAQLVMAVSPLKQMSRWEFMLEKAVELGASKIIPLLTKYTEKSKIRIDRLQRIAISAMKQCSVPYLPEITAPVSFQEYVTWDFTGVKLIPTLLANEIENLSEIARPGENVNVMIGPEGGFSEEEVQFAIQHQFRAISLGSQRLRTETAAIFVNSVIKCINQW